MILNDPEWPFCVKIWSVLDIQWAVSGSANNQLAFLAFGQNCSKIWRAIYDYIHCQRQNCSPGNLVSSKVRFIWIFAGVCWRGGVKWVWGVVNGDFRFFRSLYLPNLHIHGHNYYIVLCSPSVALHWQRNGWPSMTLNGHFALKSGSGLTSNGLAFLAFGENCL